MVMEDLLNEQRAAFSAEPTPLPRGAAI